MKRLLLAVLMIAGTFAMVPVPPATAHGGACTTGASFDANGAGKWRGHGVVHCATPHDQTVVAAYIQARNCTGCQWNDVEQWLDACTGGVTDSCNTDTGWRWLCSDKQYRIHAEGWQVTQSGDTEHFDPDNSAVKDGSHVGDSCGP